MGDQFEFSGDFRGAIVNIKSTLKNVQQSIGEIPSGDDARKKSEKTEFEDLEVILEKAPQEKRNKPGGCSTAQALVEQAKQISPINMLQITGEGLKRGCPKPGRGDAAVVTIASQIVMGDW